MAIGIIIALLFVLLIAIGVPIAVSIGIPSVVGLLWADMPLSYIAQAAYTVIDSFTVIAVPMFILSGVLMEKGGPICLGICCKLLLRAAQALSAACPVHQCTNAKALVN